MGSNNPKYQKMLAQWKRDLIESLAFNAVIGLISGAIAAWVLTLYAPFPLGFAQAFAWMLLVLPLMMIPPVMADVGRKPLPDDMKG